MLLIITGKGDGTVDALVNHLDKPFFRLNLDDFRKYELVFSNEFWEITNPVGLKIDSTIASSCFWWKAFMYQIDPDRYVSEEIKVIAESIYSWFKARESTVGNPPYLESEWGKLRQAAVASKFMKVPSQRVGWGLKFLATLESSNKKWVAKSLSANLTKSKKALFTVEINPEEIDPSYPWYLQEKLDSDFDITILVIGKELFPFEKSRLDLNGLDWRKDQFKSKTPWTPIILSKDEEDCIRSFLHEMGVSWGRIDFLKTVSGMEFLEINPNGQWVFLDPNNEFGLISKVAKYLQDFRPPKL